MRVGVDLTGQRFGWIKVIRFDGYSDTRKVKVRVWLCECDCGVQTRVSTGCLTHGITKSCGCYQREQLRSRTIKHGMSRSNDPTIKAMYGVWRAMQLRCRCDTDPAYHNYGGRGITMCDRWTDFGNFVEDMGVRPSKMHSLDRIDNNGNYCPENCRWATRKEQNSNTRRNRWLEIDGELKTLAQWEDYSGVSDSTIAGRLARGWSTKDAVFTPGRKKLAKAVSQ